jgi:hypothetical protein
LDYTGGLPLSATLSAVLAGYNNGSWNGVGFPNSSAAAAA